MTPEGEKQLRKALAKAIFDTVMEYRTSGDVDDAMIPRDVIVNAIGDVVDFAGFLCTRNDVSADAFIKLCAVVMEMRFGYKAMVQVEETPLQ